MQPLLNVQLRRPRTAVAGAMNGCVVRFRHRTTPCRNGGTAKAASPSLQVTKNKTTSSAWTRTRVPAKSVRRVRLGVALRMSRTRQSGRELSARPMARACSSLRWFTMVPLGAWKVADRATLRVANRGDSPDVLPGRPCCRARKRAPPEVPVAMTCHSIQAFREPAPASKPLRSST